MAKLSIAIAALPNLESAIFCAMFGLQAEQGSHILCCGNMTCDRVLQVLKLTMTRSDRWPAITMRFFSASTWAKDLTLIEFSRLMAPNLCMRKLQDI